MVVEIDLRGHCIERHRLARLLLGCGSRRCIGIEGRAAAGRIYPFVEVGRDGVLILALDQAAVHRTVEDFVDGAEVFADLVPPCGSRDRESADRDRYR